VLLLFADAMNNSSTSHQPNEICRELFRTFG
jgi:hypothetical protein